MWQFHRWETEVIICFLFSLVRRFIAKSASPPRCSLSHPFLHPSILPFTHLSAHHLSIFPFILLPSSYASVSFIVTEKLAKHLEILHVPPVVSEGKKKVQGSSVSPDRTSSFCAEGQQSSGSWAAICFSTQSLALCIRHFQELYMSFPGTILVVTDTC